MLLIHPIDVVGAIKASIQTEFDLPIAKNIEILDELSHGLHIRNVPGELAIIKRETGFLAKQEGEVDLGKAVVILVLAVFYLLQRFLNLVEKGTITMEYAADQSCMSVPDFEAKAKEYNEENNK